MIDPWHDTHFSLLPGPGKVRLELERPGLPCQKKTDGRIFLLPHPRVLSSIPRYAGTKFRPSFSAYVGTYQRRWRPGSLNTLRDPENFEELRLFSSAPRWYEAADFLTRFYQGKSQARPSWLPWIPAVHVTRERRGRSTRCDVPHARDLELWGNGFN